MGEYKLKFDGINISLVNPAGQIEKSWQGVSARPMHTAPSEQSVVNTGPIPEGNWTFNVSDVQHITVSQGWFGTYVSSVLQVAGIKRGFFPGGSVAWGTQRVWLSPEEGTNTYGRSGFSIHGGTVYGSAGCIDLGLYENEFFEYLKYRGIKDIKLVVNYNPDLETQPHPLAGQPAGNYVDSSMWEWAPQCFAADTPILLPDGTSKPIQAIRPGDYVLAFDPKTDKGRGSLLARKVVNIFSSATTDTNGLHF